MTSSRNSGRTGGRHCGAGRLPRSGCARRVPSPCGWAFAIGQRSRRDVRPVAAGDAQPAVPGPRTQRASDSPSAERQPQPPLEPEPFRRPSVTQERPAWLRPGLPVALQPRSGGSGFADTWSRRRSRWRPPRSREGRASRRADASRASEREASAGLRPAPGATPEPSPGRPSLPSQIPSRRWCRSGSPCDGAKAADTAPERARPPRRPGAPDAAGRRPAAGTGRRRSSPAMSGEAARFGTLRECAANSPSPAPQTSTATS